MKESSEESRWGFKASEVREIIVITLGILLAFSIEASWTEFREKDEVRRQLTAVDAELAQNLRFLQDLEAEHRAVAAAGAGLLDIAGPDAQVEDPECRLGPSTKQTNIVDVCTNGQVASSGPSN